MPFESMVVVAGVLSMFGIFAGALVYRHDALNASEGSREAGSKTARLASSQAFIFTYDPGASSIAG